MTEATARSIRWPREGLTSGLRPVPPDPTSERRLTCPTSWTARWATTRVKGARTPPVQTSVGQKCGPESADVDYYEQLFSVMEPVLREDWQLFPRMQRSLETGASPTMRLGYQERALYWMQQEIDQRIGPERIPEQLRVPQVLTGI